MEIKFNKVTYKQKNKIIIDNIDLNLKENKITSIVGPNGSGKTTLLNLLLLNKKPQEGEILFDNTSSTKSKIKNQIGVVNQNIEFNYETVSEELLHSIDSHNYKVKNKEKRIKDSLLLVGLKEDYLNRKINSLSKGQKIKLQIAKALVHNPKVLIIDELNLDEENTKSFIKLIRLMKIKYNKTIIIFTKNTDFAHTISDYIYIINKGKIITKGTKYKVFTNFKKLKENKLKPPKVIEFAKLIEDTKNVKIGYRDDINDLIKDIYRYVR